MEHLYHFNLTQDPFQNEPDLRFYFESETHRRAQLRIDRALRQSKGLVLLTGEGGTGKSVLARRIFEDLEEEVFESALMVMMQGTADATSVLRRFASELGVEAPPTERAPLIAMLYEQLAIVREDGRQVVLILDEAHALGREAMAEIGGLMNLEYEDRRLLSLLLVGLPELDTMIAGIPGLSERVDVRVPLQPLPESDAQAYIAHRIRAAGGDASIMEEAATQSLFKLGGGRPRRMNALADNALFEAYLCGRTRVGAEDVERAGRDLAFEVSAAPVPVGTVQEQPSAEWGSATAGKAPAALSTPFDAVTEIAMDSVVGMDLNDEVDPMGSSPSEEPAALSLGEVDLASLLENGSDDVALELELGDAMVEAVRSAETEEAFPSFSAENAAAPMGEATRIEFPNEIDDFFVDLLDD